MSAISLSNTYFHVRGLNAPRWSADVQDDHRDSTALFVGQGLFQYVPKLLG